MRKYILLFIFIFFSLVFLSEQYLSNRIKNLTNLFIECDDFVSNFQCSNYKKSVNEIDVDKKSLEVDINKIYSYNKNKHDLKINTIYNEDLVTRESELLNYSMFLNAMKIKDLSKTNLDRAEDYYPSSYKRDSSDFKILSVGDSYLAGAGLYSFNYTWAGTLEHKLLDSGYNVEVDRFARNGANFPDFLEMLSSKNIELLDPDMIIISLYENDLLLPIKLKDSHYYKCIINGYGNNDFEIFLKRKFPFIYSYLLSRKCDLNKLKAKYGDLVGETNYAVLEDAPFAEYYKNSMKKILDNANGRPVFIQPLFISLGCYGVLQKELCETQYQNIKDYLVYLKSIGYLIPDFDSEKIFSYSNSLGNAVKALYPVDNHWSRRYNAFISTSTAKKISEVIDNDYNIKNPISFYNTDSILQTNPIFVLHNDNNYIQYESRGMIYIDNKFAKSGISFIKEGEVVDQVLCTSINRPSVRVYLNYFKHKNDNLAFNLISAESEIAVIGIYFSENGEELYTDVKIIKPGERAEFSADEKIVGLILGSPISGCNNAEVWSMPSFIGKIIYN
jgi:hypothetical protein